MRGLKAPPRSMAAPAATTASTTPVIWSWLSTAQGPAITTKPSPPRTAPSGPPTATRESAERKSRLVSCWAPWPSTTRSTPVAVSRTPAAPGASFSVITSVAPSNSPITGSSPLCRSRACTCAIWWGVASLLMTAIIWCLPWVSCGRAFPWRDAAVGDDSRTMRALGRVAENRGAPQDRPRRLSRWGSGEFGDFARRAKEGERREGGTGRLGAPFVRPVGMRRPGGPRFGHRRTELPVR